MRDNSYANFVRGQAEINPSLGHLRNFMSSISLQRYPCRIVVLEVPGEYGVAKLRQLRDTKELHHELDGPDPETKTEVTAGPSQSQSKEHLVGGKIILIEDLTTELIEILGEKLNIDPLFFASHIHTPWVNSSNQDTNISTLPSRLKPHDFVNIHHQRTLRFEGLETTHEKFMRATNVPRKVRILWQIEGLCIGFSQSCMSIYRIGYLRGNWTGLILVDPPVCQLYSYNDSGLGSPAIECSSRLFGGGFDDFLHPPSMTQLQSKSDGPHRDSLLDSITHYWRRNQLEKGDGINMTTLRLSEYPLRIVASEWMIYYQVMRYSIKQYEYSPTENCRFLYELQKLNANLQALQRWRRRVLSSSHKLSAVMFFLASHRSVGKELDLCHSLTDDFEYVTNSIDKCGRLMESMLPVVTYFVQIVDSRRALAETTNITKLTILALVFVPLTFVSSLFSMNDGFGPKGANFWQYFAVAVPITCVVLAVAQFPHIERDNFNRSADSRLKRSLGSIVDV